MYLAPAKFRGLTDLFTYSLIHSFIHSLIQQLFYKCLFGMLEEKGLCQQILWCRAL